MPKYRNKKIKLKYHKNVSLRWIHWNAINEIISISNNRILISALILIRQLNVKVIDVFLSLRHPT